MGLFNLFKKKTTTTNKLAEEVSTIPQKDVWKSNKPIFREDLESFVFEMRTNLGEKYTFILNGNCLYCPNMSSTSGYGSDDWYYICKLNNQDCLLLFTCNASYGPVWDYDIIDENQAKSLPNEEPEKWIDAYYSKRREAKGIILHPLDIISAKNVIKSTCSRMGKLTDDNYYGFIPTFSNEIIERIKTDHFEEFSKIENILSNLKFEMTEQTITCYLMRRESNRIPAKENVIKIQQKNPKWFTEAYFFNHNGTYNYIEFSNGANEILFHPCDNLWDNFVDTVHSSITNYGKNISVEDGEYINKLFEKTIQAKKINEILKPNN